MKPSFTRRSLLAGSGAAALTTTLPAGVVAQHTIRTGRLVERQPPVSAMIANTRYFEIDSATVGARYAVWVTTPPGYEKDLRRRYPPIYMPDGNFDVAQTAPANQLLPTDPIHPIVPFIQVSIGYADADVPRMLAVRARDLLPPDEPLPEGIEAGTAATVKTSLLDEAGAALYLHNLQHPAADKFLDFLTGELHPLIAKDYRLADDGAGLFGYSYGGLFAAYVAMRRSSLFRRIGAGSPGILEGRSSVLAMYASELKSKTDHSGRMLHMTVNAAELTASSYYRQLVGAGTIEFIRLAAATPLPGLAFSNHIVDLESHASGLAPSWFSFLRACYSASGGQLF